MSRHSSRGYPFVSLIAAVAGSAVLWFGGAWFSHNQIQHLQRSVVDATEPVRLRGEVLRLDEVLTMSVRMAAATGDPHWIDRYNAAEPELLGVLDALRARGINLEMGAAGSQTSTANDALVAIERQALAHVMAGDLSSAQKLMTSDRYAALKAEYSEGMTQLLSLLEQLEYGTKENAADTEQRVLAIAAIVMLGLLLLWFNFAHHRRVYRGAQRALQGALKNDLVETSTRFRAVIDHAPVVIFATDPDGIFEYSDGAALTKLGLKPGEVVGVSVWTLYADYPDILEYLQRCLGGKPQFFAAYVNECWFRTVVIPVRRGDRFAMLGVSTDVTAEVHAHRDTARFMEAIDHSTFGFVMLDADGRIEHASSAFCLMLDEPREALIGESILGKISDGPSLEALSDALAKPQAGSVVLDEIPVRANSGETLARMHLSTVSMSDGIHHLIATQDLADQRMMQEALDQARLVDPSTDLPNRVALLDTLQSGRRQQHRLYYIDLDQFHRVNAALNPTDSEQLMSIMAQRLIETTGERASIYRVGGDEFVLHELNASSELDAHIGDLLRETLARDVRIDGRSINLTASIGIAEAKLYGTGGEEELLQHAEAAMYAAKRAGRNCCHIYRESMQRQSKRALQVESRLREALRNGGLAVYYQPVVRLSDGMPCSAEALLRWTDDELGPVSPGEFVPIAEQLGLSGELGRFVFSTACRDVSNWNQALENQLGVALNCAADQLSSPDFVDMLTDPDTLRGLSPQQFELELTERVLVAPSEQVKSNLYQLKQQGFRLSLDDFGTGYSALSYLREYPLDTLKLDRSFVSDIEHPSTRKLCQAIVSMGMALDIKTIAEGIESGQQAAALCGMGYAMGQGFHYAPALPFHEFVPWVAERSARQAT